MIPAIMTAMAQAIPVAVTPTVSGVGGIYIMLLDAGPVVKGIMLLLLLQSVLCWGIVIAKTGQFGKSARESDLFRELFREKHGLSRLRKESEAFAESHLAFIFMAGYTELERIRSMFEGKPFHNHEGFHDIMIENVDRAVQGGIIMKKRNLQSFLPFLATTGSTAPFIGLFGTVWGIITSFQDIGMKGSASLAVVAPGISEALVATAMGLAAAIPAVAAFNWFSNKIMILEDDMLHFSADLLNILRTESMVGSTPGEFVPKKVSSL